MDTSAVHQQRSREQTINAAKKRFQSFRARQAQSPPVPPPPKPVQQQQHHTRSHSRGNSISFQISKSSVDDQRPPSIVRSRPNSHHKRNSSVSTRRDSQELMGISAPPEEASGADKETDPIKRALWALEGKGRMGTGSFANPFVSRVTPVEIPDLDSPEFGKKVERSDSRKPMPLSNSLSGKRDSFGKMMTASSSNKAELGTLVEEEEEEEETVSSPHSEPLLTPPTRPRPQNLTIRPLSLTNTSLPTPAPTPSPRPTGLKSLTLTASPATHTGSPHNPSPGRRSNGTPGDKPVRRRSVSYKRSEDFDVVQSPSPKSSMSRPSLPLTPEPTPTIASPVSPDLSPSRQAFIYHSHSALLSRISELEDLLAARSPNFQKNVPLPVLRTSSEDEFLALIADLKAERDELKHDVEGWRVRVADLEKQVTMLTKRVETERRQGWMVKDQLGVLEIEKAGIEADVEQLKTTVDLLNGQVDDLSRELARERAEKEELHRILSTTISPRSPDRLKFVGRSRVNHFNGCSLISIDSESSTTDVEEVSYRSSVADSLVNACLKLKVVEEEQERDEQLEDDQLRDSGAEELAHYEDADDSDSSFYSPSRSNSSMSLRFSSPPAAIQPSPPTTTLPAVSSPKPSPKHSRSSSLSKAWTFPSGPVSASEPKPVPVDKFFLCLEDTADAPVAEEDVHTVKPSLGFGFGHGFGASGDEDEDLPPFVLPIQSHPTQHGVPAFHLMEEDEEEVDFKFPIAKTEPKPLQFSVTPPNEHNRIASLPIPAPAARHSSPSASGHPLPPHAVPPKSSIQRVKIPARPSLSTFSFPPTVEARAVDGVTPAGLTLKAEPVPTSCVPRIPVISISPPTILSSQRSTSSGQSSTSFVKPDIRLNLDASCPSAVNTSVAQDTVPRVPPDSPSIPECSRPSARSSSRTHPNTSLSRFSTLTNLFPVTWLQPAESGKGSSGPEAVSPCGAALVSRDRQLARLGVQLKSRGPGPWNYNCCASCRSAPEMCL